MQVSVAAPVSPGNMGMLMLGGVLVMAPTYVCARGSCLWVFLVVFRCQFSSGVSGSSAGVAVRIATSCIGLSTGLWKPGTKYHQRIDKVPQEPQQGCQSGTLLPSPRSPVLFVHLCGADIVHVYMCAL
jgi:hypothetical protein